MGAVVFYGLLPRTVDLWSQVPSLRSIGLVALIFVALLQFASWWCSAGLDRVALPDLSRFAAITASLAANAVSRVVPAAGGALGMRTKKRMWTAAGIEVGTAGSAIAATTFMSLATLFVLPVVTLLLALIGTPVPRSLVWVGVGGAGLFVVLFGVGMGLLTNDTVLRAVARFAQACGAKIGRQVTAEGIEEERDRLRVVLGRRWSSALALSVGIWAFDYLSLVAVLVALHTKPHLSVVLLAFTAAKILAMIPITPGGLGIVEAGLVGVLTLAGIPAAPALLATLAYRIASFWLSLPTGLIAWRLVMHRRALDTKAV